jgi:hypothetical protein
MNLRRANRYAEDCARAMTLNATMPSRHSRVTCNETGVTFQTRPKSVVAVARPIAGVGGEMS